MAKATEAVDLGKIVMPTEVIAGINQKVKEQSFIAALSPNEPQIFTNREYAIFTEEPEGEFVEAGAAKSSSSFGLEPKMVNYHKFQTTVRMDEEVQWADEDNRLLILDRLMDAIAASQARGLDYGLGHGINPLTRETLSSFDDEAIIKNAKQVAATDDPVADLDALPDSIIDDYDVNGIALDRRYAADLRKVRVPSTGARQFPEIGLDLNPGSVDGIRSVTTGSVSGRRLIETPTGVKAILGNWDLVHWGYAREFGIEQINYGDPDGLGDLKRYNQVAYRAECLFAWVVMDYNGLVVLRDKSTMPVGLNLEGAKVATSTKKSE